MPEIKHIILLSGKRKCGKDFVSERLHSRLGPRSEIVRISEPIKREWSKKLNLSLEELLSDAAYKERYRVDMIEWSDKARAEDYAYFCKAAMKDCSAEIIIVSDIRRKGDIRFFREVYGNSCSIHALRLTCPEVIRAERGWIYTQGVDDVTSECDLDSYEAWDMVLENNNQLDGEQIIDLILARFEF